MTRDTIRLRGYQADAVKAVFQAWIGRGMKRPAVVLPTGAGKTILFSAVIEEYLAWSGGRYRVVVLAHRDELIDQALDKIRQVAPGLRTGKVKAADDDVSAQVVVASVQTLARAHRLQRLLDAPGAPVGLIITDECHHAVAASYRGVYAAFPDALHLGVTATLARGDGVGLGSVWEDVVFQRSILHLVADGYLVDVRGQAIDLGIDLAGVKRTGGDYAAGALGDALEQAHGPELAARAIHEHAADRRPLAFTPTVGTAHALARELERKGITTGVVSGATPREERLRTYADVQAGRLRGLVNCQVLTEGFDLPLLDTCAVVRPTRSLTLWTQMVGRVLRPWPGKTGALVLAMGGDVPGLRTLVDLAPGDVRTVEPGETLADAAVRTAAEGDQRVPAGSLAFSLRNRDLDLFAASGSNWLRTRAGVLFLADLDSEVFLWPAVGAPGFWDVCRAPKHGSWVRLHTGLQLGTAQAWAETEMGRSDADFALDREARWRRAKPEAGQLKFAARLRIEVPEGARKGWVSDQISIRLASLKMDRYVRTTEGVRA